MGNKSFYTSFFQRGNFVYVRGYDKGLRFKKKIPYKPYLFVPSKNENTKFKTLQNKPVEKLPFSSIKEAKEFYNKYKNVSNAVIYGLNRFDYLYIYDTYKGKLDFDRNLINCVTLDIETRSKKYPDSQIMRIRNIDTEVEEIINIKDFRKIDFKDYEVYDIEINQWAPFISSCFNLGEFPDTEKGDKEVTAITLTLNGKVVSFGCQDFELDFKYIKTNNKVYYVKCETEEELLDKFLQVWNSDAWAPDVVTSWFGDGFDIPYLVNRIKRVLGEEASKRLSPWRIIYERTITDDRGKVRKIYDLKGIQSLDYMELFKKFTFKTHESYKLDFIAEQELDEKKLDYTEFKNIDDFYLGNFQKFLEYNIYDCLLIDKLEAKLGFINLALAFAYDAKVNYTDTMATVQPWDIIIHNHLLNKGVVIPPFKQEHDTRIVEGGYVKIPKVGLYKWGVSFDLTSLYPHNIMGYNISPETYVGHVDKFTIDDFINENPECYEYRKKLNEKNLVMTPLGSIYTKDFQGFAPELMELFFNERAEYKKIAAKAEKDYNKTNDLKYKNIFSTYDNLQKAKKIQINAFYGMLANLFCRWFSFNDASAITAVGRMTIQWISNEINKYLNNYFNTQNVDYVIANDTDSAYINFEALINMHPELKTDDEKSDFLSNFSKEVFQPFLKERYEYLAEYMFAYKNKMLMKRENIFEKGIWTGKKRYILRILDGENGKLPEPKIKITGIESVRSTTPQVCRKSIKEAIKIIMEGTQDDLIDYIDKFRIEFDNSEIKQVATPSGLNGLHEYADAATIYKIRTPMHIKGALLYNWFVRKNSLTNKLQLIQTGDKVRFTYLKPHNPLHNSVIAFPDDFPEELGLGEYVDYDRQFQKSFIEPVKRITNVIGWKTEHVSTLAQFFGD